MAKKNGKRRAKRGITVPVAIIGPIGYNLAQRIDEISRGVSWAEVMDRLQYSYTGYSTVHKNFKFDRMTQGALPLAVGTLVHNIAKRFGVNRALGSAGIPIIRI